jgi:hypothetical protein
MVIAVRLRVLTARLNLPLARIWPATNGTGEPLGKSFPGLRVTIATGIEPGANSRQRLIIFALALVLSVTLFAGYPPAGRAASFDWLRRAPVCCERLARTETPLTAIRISRVDANDEISTQCRPPGHDLRKLTA